VGRVCRGWQPANTNYPNRLFAVGHHLRNQLTKCQEKEAAKGGLREGVLTGRVLIKRTNIYPFSL
jgi:hypothetical protein